MPRLTGLDVLRALRQGGDGTPVILLTTFDDDEVLLEGVRGGIAGFLLKDVGAEQLVQALRTVASGGTLILPAVSERAARYVKREGIAFDAAELPDRLTR